MKLYDFISRFPNEEACKEHFISIRQKHGVKCPKCECEHCTYLPSRTKFECKECGCRFSLRSGTVMHGSKLPFRYWFITIHLLTATKHTFSALEIQRQLGHNRYQPIWEMVPKLRNVMGKRDAEYNLTGYVELEQARKQSPIKHVRMIGRQRLWSWLKAPLYSILLRARNQRRLAILRCW